MSDPTPLFDPGRIRPRHNEDRARREFVLRTAEEARDYAKERLRDWLTEHPGIRPTPRRH